MNVGPASGAWAGLVDDAALFPPGEAPLPEALPAHAAHRAAWYAELVGAFVHPAPRAAELAAAAPPGTLDVSLTLPGGPATYRPAATALGHSGRVRLVAAEVVVPEDLDSRSLVDALDVALAEGVRGYVELPRSARRNEVLRALAGTRYHAKLRTGGIVAEAFPDESELAGAIVACVRQGTPFKCTAGLHRAVRRRDPETGFEHHGFLNVLLATAAALDGDEPDAVAAVLAQRDPDRLVADYAFLGPDGAAAARSRFTSFGSCSIDEPVEDLVHLGLLHPPVSAPVPAPVPAPATAGGEPDHDVA
ncbi:MAG: hypothetical protein QOF84_5999 [Streptomyces sp.]|jgi:hypothetical protein|nr:hypothetical protein [Streptomyces sp.]